MSASIAQLDNSRFARRQELDTLYLQIATVSKKNKIKVNHKSTCIIETFYSLYSVSINFFPFHPIYHTLEFGLCHTDGICPGHSAGLHAPT